MRITRPLLALALTAALPIAALAAGQPQVQKKGSTPITVGDFAGMLAAQAAKGPISDAKGAAKIVAAVTAQLGDPKATLSEQKLAELLGNYGFRVTGSPSNQAATHSQAESAAVLISGSLRSGVSAASTAPSPSDLNDCFALANHGQCENCCKALGGDPSTCSKFCFEINKGSAGEPLP